MFSGCEKLTSVDLSSFDTSKVENMESMFKNCKSLVSLDLSNFKTNRVSNMNYLFSGCILLTSINIANFEVKSSCSTSDMFSNCQNLEYVNLKKFNRNGYFISDCQKNLVICSENNNLIEEIKKHECNVVDCSNNWYEKKKKIIR